MKLAIKVIAIVFVSMIIFGCEDPIPPQSTDKKTNCHVEFLFEQDGIKVYRFHDGYYDRYFTTRGDTFWQESHGKTTKPMEVPSVPLDTTEKKEVSE
jgi:hypothetical protein